MRAGTSRFSGKWPTRNRACPGRNCHISPGVDHPLAGKEPSCPGGLRTDLVQGETFALTLRFERAGHVTVIARVRGRVWDRAVTGIDARRPHLFARFVPAGPGAVVWPLRSRRCTGRFNALSILSSAQPAVSSGCMNRRAPSASGPCVHSLLLMRRSLRRAPFF
jgi:hypothetical protein